jgi:hypothetical protein
MLCAWGYLRRESNVQRAHRRASTFLDRRAAVQLSDGRAVLRQAHSCGEHATTRRFGEQRSFRTVLLEHHFRNGTSHMSCVGGGKERIGAGYWALDRKRGALCVLVEVTR